MAVKSTRRPTYASRAVQDAALQFAPKRSALAEQLRNAREEYGSTVQAGRSTANLTKQAVAEALPQIAKIYSKADAAQQAGATLVGQDLAALPGAADTFKAGSATEVQQQLANLIGARARDQGMLAKSGVAAAAGAQFNQQNARAVLQKAVAGILGKSQGVAEEEGAKAASEAEKLAAEADKMAQDERQAVRSAETSRANAQEGAATKRRGQNLTRQSAKEAHSGQGGDYTAPGVKRLTTDQHNAARDSIEQIRHEAYEMRHDEHLNFNESRAELEEPVPKLRKAYPANGKLKAALELAYFGGISDGTIKKLHSEGISAKQLGYPRYRKVKGVPRLERIK